MSVSHRIRNTAVVVGAVALLFAGVVVLLTVVNLKAAVHDLSTGQSPAAVKRLRYQAEQRFLTCSTDRKKGPMSSEEAQVCRGYETLATAYRTQGVTPPPSRSTTP